MGAHNPSIHLEARHSLGEEEVGGSELQKAAPGTLELQLERAPALPMAPLCLHATDKQFGVYMFVCVHVCVRQKRSSHPLHNLPWVHAAALGRC